MITSARPRPPSGHPGRLGRRDHDGRAPCTGRIVAATRVVGCVRGDARAGVVDGLDQRDARRRVIDRRVRERVRDDHTGVINTHMECLPPARATASMLRSGPFTRTGNRQASAVDEEMKGIDAPICQDPGLCSLAGEEALQASNDVTFGPAVRRASGDVVDSRL